jgi:hypothetical protein
MLLHILSSLHPFVLNEPRSAVLATGWSFAQPSLNHLAVVRAEATRTRPVLHY